jgi:hypothetical protein
VPNQKNDTDFSTTKQRKIFKKSTFDFRQSLTFSTLRRPSLALQASVAEASLALQADAAVVRRPGLSASFGMTSA